MPQPKTSASVRVRFAPSPTGFLHIGGLRTALYNYLFARKNNGAFILRIEDTDRERFVEEAEKDILDSMEWAGLSYDEGPDVGGEAGPYYQSERGDIYREYAEKLVDGGQAYYAFDTVEELEQMKEEWATEDNPTPTYDLTTRHRMRNSLTLPDDEVQQLLDSGTEHVIRLMVPQDETIQFSDRVRGGVSFESDRVDDQVLLKTDGMPTYHLANVVDDHLMGITHVIRGEEWLPSTPKHMLLYRYFGWTPPEWAHLPLILSPRKGKLSKRDAEELGIPISVHQYEDAGYEPEALLNFLAFLGWNPGTEQEIFSLDELIEAFSLDRVGSSGVQFDIDKLNWFNAQYLHRLSAEELADRAQPFVEDAGYTVDRQYLVRVVDLLGDRINLASEVPTKGDYFFEGPTDYNREDVEKSWKDESADVLVALADRLEEVDDLDEDQAESALKAVSDEMDVGLGRIIRPARIALSGTTSGPGIYGMMATIGRNRCVQRMRRAAEEVPRRAGSAAA